MNNTIIHNIPLLYFTLLYFTLLYFGVQYSAVFDFHKIICNFYAMLQFVKNCVKIWGKKWVKF